MEGCRDHTGHAAKIEAIEQQVKEFHRITERITIVEQSSKSAHHRLDNLQDQTKAIIEMSASVKYLAMQVEEMVTLIKDHDKRIEAVERAPDKKEADNARKVKWLFFTIGVGQIVVVVGGLISFWLSNH